MIEIHKLIKAYKNGVTAINQLDLTIQNGMFGLLGPNGAGKTTLMRILVGLLQPTSGVVKIFGEDISTKQGISNVRKVLGYLPQYLDLPPHLSAYEFLDYVGVLKGVVDNSQRRKQIDRLLEAVALADKSRQALRTFSGGMKRRVGIAQALLGEPKLLIVDEPTTGLDPEERLKIRNMLSEIARTSTVLLSTHIIDDVGQSCKELAIIAYGRTLFQGSPQTLAEQIRDKVWIIKTEGDVPRGDFEIITSTSMIDGVEYRVLGYPNEQYQAKASSPRMEDAYIWVMRQQNAEFGQNDIK